MNFHVEVHTRDGQIEHLICLYCENKQEAIDRVIEHYRDRDIKIGLWEVVKDKPEIEYYIFRVENISDAPVVYIAGEYRSSYPI